jgi:hypothetical protein
MENKVKNYLNNIIKEGIESQYDEMARRPKNIRSDDKDIKMRPLFAPENPTKPGEEGTPDGWLVNPTAFQGETSFETTEPFIVIPLDCDELETLKSKWGEWFQELETEHNAPVDFISCTRGKFMRPVEKALIGGYKPTGKKMSAQQRMKRYDVFPMLKNFFTSEENLDIFNKRSVPVVPFTIEPTKRRSFENQYVEWSNDKILYETHNANSYETAEDFLSAAINRIRGKEDDKAKTYHLARQYNTKYGNWSADRKNQKYWEGFTDVYGLEKRGFTEQNLDVTVRMDFKLLGERVGPADFMWTIKMETKIGKKLQEDRRISGGFLDDKQIAVTKSVTLDPNKTYTDEFPITRDLAVSQGLQEALQEFKEKLEAIKPNQVLKMATVPSRFQGTDTNLQEQKERLVKRITTKLNLK